MLGSLKDATQLEIIERAKILKGKHVVAILNGEEINVRDKGNIGNIIQVHGFGIPANNSTDPDFEKAGIELKIVPLKLFKKNGEFNIKERTKVCSINYNEILNETWDRSHAKIKLSKILFVFYKYDEIDLLNSQIIDYSLFDLADHTEDEKILKNDWQLLHKKVLEGRAHEISERLFTFLAASTSGPGGVGSMAPQPVTKYSKKAKKRSFSLKPSYTRVLWKQVQGVTYDSLFLKNTDIRSQSDIEHIVLSAINKYKGRNLIEVAKELNFKEIGGKDLSARLVRAMLGFKGKYKPIKEIEQLGLLVKALPIRLADNMPWEGMSFQHQPFIELLQEGSFEESLLYSYIQGILIIPIIRENRRSSQDEMLIGRAFIWHPADEEIDIAKREWKTYKTVIEKGIIINRKPANTKSGYREYNNLPNESDTQMIHMRPHGADGLDKDKSLVGIEITKQAFWLNKRFLQTIIQQNN